MLLGLGLQHKSVEDLEKDLDLPVSQLLGLFIKIVRKLVTFFNEVLEKDVEKTMVERQEIEMVPATQSIDEELVIVILLDPDRSKQKEYISDSCCAA